MKQSEYEFYDRIKNWDFSDIKYTEDVLTNWDMYELLRQYTNKDSRVLDLGTGGGEKVLKFFPDVKEIIATDFSEGMIETAKENLKQSGRKNIVFYQMDNHAMTTEKNYFDVVVARHTCIEAKQVYETLKDDGILILRGVDKLDCWQLKRMFHRGQAYHDALPISFIDYDNILNAGFKHVELVPIHVREYYETEEDLYALLAKTPILDDFSEMNPSENAEHKEIEKDIFKQYVTQNTTSKGILLIRRYYGILATKK